MGAGPGPTAYFRDPLHARENLGLQHRIRPAPAPSPNLLGKRPRHRSRPRNLAMQKAFREPLTRPGRDFLQLYAILLGVTLTVRQRDLGRAGSPSAVSALRVRRGTACARSVSPLRCPRGLGSHDDRGSRSRWSCRVGCGRHPAAGGRCGRPTRLGRRVVLHSARRRANGPRLVSGRHGALSGARTRARRSSGELGPDRASVLANRGWRLGCRDRLAGCASLCGCPLCSPRSRFPRFPIARRSHHRSGNRSLVVVRPARCLTSGCS